MFRYIRELFGIRSREEILIEAVRRGVYVIDVRTPAEYKMGHIQQAGNISLDQIAANAEKIRKIGKPVITCCESGSRSGRASRILKRRGIESYNGGGWINLKLLIKAATG
ncbi:MAG TPA: rhodanese-like domain-containing protein [Cyclobacteriaceae bacterium]|nr:rhodanese-like domain-containing protein [Cyclobacteriaceae bacterium]